MACADHLAEARHRAGQPPHLGSRGSHILAASALDLEADYALHQAWRSVLGFLRAGVGTRFELVGGGASRTRLALVVGLGVKVRAGPFFALRADIEYRYLAGAPGVAGELALLIGPEALW